MKSIPIIAFLLLVSKFSHAQWTPGGIQLSSTPDNNYSPQIAMSTKNSAWEVWRGKDTTVSQKGTLYLTGYDKHGYPLNGFTGWPIPIGNNGDFYMPQIVMSGDTEIIVAWYGYADTTSSFSEIYIQKYTQSGIALWNGGTAVQVSIADSNHNKLPQLASDKNGGAYVCWTRYDYNIYPSSADILLQRIDGNGQVASGWTTTPNAVAAIPGVRESYAKIAVTPSGDAVYVQYYKGLIGNLSLWLKRINAADGSVAAGFSTGSGALISSGPNLVPVLQVENFILCDSSGNALSVWCEYRISANGEIYYQKTSSTGSQTFAVGGGKRIAGNNADGYGYLYASLDDDGSILATWNDYVVWYDIGCAKFTTDGTIVWQHSATPITVNNNSAYPKIIPDHKGGSYVFYVDVTSALRRLYCLRLDAAGNLLWPLPGLYIGFNWNQDPFDPQFDYQVMNVDSQQANATWEYLVSNLFNVFACDVLPSMQSCFDATEGVPSFNLLSEGITISPNPSTDQFTVFIPETAFSSPLYFELYNEMGMLVLQRLIHESSVIRTTGLGTGFYIGKFFDDKGNCHGVKKIILQK